ncbi:MAG: chromosome partition protein Smc [Nitrospinaceae bacterium]|nr:MAG: chromosome partition protein Smc [Nitrospinaceae bacterium]
MILKSLELEGFKSFVDSTRLQFNNGFTAIVGPNGCGKSNVSDAIRWVIGEQSSKSLRGTKTTDLIFNGSGSRKPVNRAEISLTLKNVPSRIRIANVPNLAEEVKITRCYHRSGESEFYINQVPCRLKDITDFLMDMGISPKVLSVIEQGHIQDIITSKPEDRRILIEEAAGILKFKHRRNEAIRKLEASSQNLERISDIVQELRRQAESLKRQAAKADRYKTYQSEIKDLSLKLFSRKIRLFQDELEEIETVYNAQNEQKTQQSARFSHLENQITQLNIEIDEMAQALSEKKDQVYQLTSQIGKNEHGIELKQSEIGQAKRDVQVAGEEILRMSEEIKSQTAQAESKRQELGDVSNEINEQEEILHQNNQGLAQDKTVVQELDSKVRKEEEKILANFHRISQKNNQLTALDTRKQLLESRNEQLHREFEETQVQTGKIKETQLQAASRHQEKLNAFSLLKEQRANLARENGELQSQLQVKLDAFSSLKDNALTQSSLLSSLKELRNKFEGFQDGVKSLMSNNTNGNRIAGLREILVDVLKTPAEYETAVEAVLGEKLQSIIVDSYSDTVEAIRYLQDHQAGRGSFIPLRPKSHSHPPVHLNGNPSVVGKVVDVVECKEEYRSIIETLLGNVVMVKDLDTAFEMHENENFNSIAVTQNGEMVDAQGLVTGGAVQKNSSGLLTRKREIETLTETVYRLQDEMHAAENSIDHLKNSLSERKEQLASIEKSVHENEIALNGEQKDLEQLAKEIERLEHKFSTLDYEKSNVALELKELTQQQEHLREETALAEREKAQLEESIVNLRREVEQKREALESKNAEISVVKVRIASLIGKRENTLTEIKRLDLQQENHRHRIQNLEDARQVNSGKISELQTEIESLEKQILEQAREKDRLGEEIVLEEETLTEKEESQEQMEKETRDLSRQIQELTESISKIELKRSELKIQTTHLEEKAYDDFNATREEMMRAYDENTDEQAVEEQVRELKAKVAKMGEVNLAALSDFQETNERYTFLNRQQEDLEESILMLHNTIEKINRTTKQRFLETFEQVNENFQATFARLFQGGKAELALTDESNPLESGIEITANPMGKSMQNLSLMSGGEKSLTAIALIFAIFKVRPSPFCLLDEVDAPLDEANVIRFQEMLKEMALNTQFILITHNQKTMSFADVLYGITMEERGVSKAVSVQLN